MKSLIFYGCPIKLTYAHKMVTGRKQPLYFVRTEMFDGPMDEALSKAKPHDAEVVLNTVEVFSNEEVQ